MNKFNILVFLYSLLCLCSCYKSEYAPHNLAKFNSFTTKRTFNQSIDVADNSTTAENLQLHNKIIKNGTITLLVDDLEKTNKQIQKILQKYNAYIFNDSQYETQDRKTNSLIIKVPSDNFDKLLNDIVSIAKDVESKNISVNDVSEQYFDAETRLKNKQQLENRYLEIIKKATKVSDLLDIENNLNNVRTEIESLTKELKSLDNKINFSTLTVNFYINKNVSFKYLYDLNKSLHESWANFIKLILFLIRNFAYLLLIFIVITMLIRKIKK